MAELDNSGNIVKSYLYNPDNNEPISVTESGNSYWYLNDHLMTPQKMVDSSEAVVWSVEYKAFGEVIINPTSTITNNLRFPGQYTDEESALYYNANRYHVPQTGRFMSKDLINPAVKYSPIIPINIVNIAFITESARPVFSGLPISRLDRFSSYFLQDPISLHSYIYSRNNPINFIDPMGYSTCHKWCHRICSWSLHPLCFPACHWMWVIVPEGPALVIVCHLECIALIHASCNSLCDWRCGPEPEPKPKPCD